jgi:hypothetical protein
MVHGHGHDVDVANNEACSRPPPQGPGSIEIGVPALMLFRPSPIVTVSHA